MKKLIGLFSLLLLVIFTGCSKEKRLENVVADLKNEIESADSYLMKGNLAITKDDKVLSFDMEVSYAKDDFYKVVYKNASSKASQVIVKNNNGVYVLEPELNKEFKFDSTWPDNSSHIYILKSIISDLSNDNDKRISEDENGVYIESKISHKVHKKLDTQRIMLNPNDYSLNSISYLEGDTERMKFSVQSLEYNLTFASDYFNEEKIMSESAAALGEGEALDILFKEVGYIGANATLDEANSKTEENCVILSYIGDSNYVITILDSEALEVASVSRIYTDFVLLTKGIGLVSNNALTYYIGNKEVKITSAKLDLETMVEIADSIEFEEKGE